ncbi:Plant intracellular Ras-group-related LRR protein 2 [Candida viswanathii]|uniref:Plant intracellular Ras-group-related LRR protein 2 n=1 Tax=Candida viswanathii TaxID=5486 RepID=A0A367YMQ5_9ASCO|nr:Plant intracellular Ras-group-related LRR protein 2 [Candida viswanathii]
MELNDFPTELLELIFSYVPKAQLFEWKDIPELSGIVWKVLYRRVIINKTHSIHDSPDDTTMWHELKYGKLREECIEMGSTGDLLRLLKRVPAISLHTIEFRLSELVLEFYKNKKDLLELIQIALLYDCIMGLPEEILQAISRQFRVVNAINLLPDKLLKWVLNARSISTVFPAVTDFLREHLPNLKVLRTEQYLWSLESLNMIPRQVVDLQCQIDLFPVHEKHVRPNLPLNLERLVVTFRIIRSLGIRERVLHFEQLQNLKSIHTINDDLMLCFFPRGVLDIETGGILPFDTFASDHASLRKFRFNQLVQDPYAEPDVFALPSQLEELCLCGALFRSPCTVLSGIERNRQLQFPDSLRRLSIGQSRENTEEVLLDFNQERLPNLEYLEVRNMQHLQITGGFSSSVKELVIRNVQHLDFDFKDFSNLEKLLIRFCYKSDGTFNVPDSLKILDLLDNGLKSVKITGKNLRQLNLALNSMAVIDEQTLILPEIEELDLSSNYVRIISPNTRWPKSLRKLDLGSNLLNQSYYFPAGLKSLSLTYNFLGDRLEWCIFPEELEYLNLSNNRVKSNKLKTMSLTRFTQLKGLYLDYNLLVGINTSQLPTRNLEVLSFKCNNIKRITGSFMNFHKLERLDVRDNPLEPKLHIKSHVAKVVPLHTDFIT